MSHTWACPGLAFHIITQLARPGASLSHQIIVELCLLHDKKEASALNKFEPLVNSYVSFTRRVIYKSSSFFLFAFSLFQPTLNHASQFHPHKHTVCISMSIFILKSSLSRCIFTIKQCRVPRKKCLRLKPVALH